MEIGGIKADLRVLGLVATILLLGAFFGFVGGKAVSDLPMLGPAVEIDNRVEVTLSPQQKADVLKSMRLDLEALQGIQASLAAGDFKTAARYAGERGAAANPLDPSLRSALSGEWKATESDLRESFDEIAAVGRAAANSQSAEGPGEAVNSILSLNARALRACVACHQAYHIVLPKPL